MGISRELLDQIGHRLRPLATRIANTVARAVVQLADDSKKLQLVQLGVLATETIDGAEHHQSYGFSSVPLAGAEAVVVFPNGDRSHPLVIAASDRRYRPTGGQPGEVTVYNNAGAKITLTKDGDVEVAPAAGRNVFVRESGGTAQRLLTDLDGQILRTALGSAVIAVGANGAAAVVAAMDVAVAALVPPPVPPTWPIRTKTLKAE